MTESNTDRQMYLVQGEVSEEQASEIATIIALNTSKKIGVHQALRTIGTPIPPCGDVETVCVSLPTLYDCLRDFNRAQVFPVSLRSANGTDIELVRRTDMEARLAIQERTVKTTMRALDAKTDHYLTVRNERDVLKEQIAEKDAEIAHLRVVEAEMHLLEEVCAFYANDEDRFIKADGNAEPYGMIPTDVGMKARSARARFMAREQAAQDAGGDA